MRWSDGDRRHRVVIVGGGFGGLAAARALRGAPVEVTLLDRRNFHLFQPLLYQVATGSLSPANIAAPLRALLRRQRNARVLLAEARAFDPANRRVLLADGDLPYDTLVVAGGVSHHYFGHDEWAPLAPGLKTVEDATEIRSRILLAFERAERARDDAARAPLLTFVVVGGGPTGVELAGALAEIARATLRDEFRRMDPGAARILLLEAAQRVLPTYPPDLSRAAEVALRRLGVVVRTGAVVSGVRAGVVEIGAGAGAEAVAAETVLWAAGVRASPLGRELARATGAPLDRAGRVRVAADLTVPGHPEIVVIGDLAYCERAGAPLPGVAPVAMQQGAYAGRLIRARLRGRAPAPFSYRDRGTLATIGRHAAVADVFGVRFTGYPAWLVWLFVHLMNIVQFRNRLLVLVQWAWNYWTCDRSARLITGETAARLDAADRS